MIDTPQEAAAGDKAARELLKVEKLKAINSELLEALRDMVESYQYEASSENPALLKARATIAKAEGKA
jgi:hypothetical protein